MSGYEAEDFSRLSDAKRSVLSEDFCRIHLLFPSTEVSRGLLQFAEGKALGPEGLFWSQTEPWALVGRLTGLAGGFEELQVEGL